MENIKFKPATEFESALQQQVSAYFKGKSKQGGKTLYVKTIIIFAFLVSTYVLAMNTGAIILFPLLGLLVALVGFNVMHDASHGSYSEHKLLNVILAWFGADVMGGSRRLWHEKHDIIHHNHTNIVGVDSDIGKHPLFRLAPSHKHKWFHRLQHIYCWLFYCFTTIYWFYVDDFVVYGKRRIANEKRFIMTIQDHILFWVGKITHFSLFVIIPLFILGWNWYTLWNLLIMHASASLFLAIVFQMAHVVEIVDFYLPDEDLNSWHVHELKTTADFATNSKVWTFLLGGLNFQVEHHLFRDVSHSHYPALNRIVKRLCVQHNIPYNEFPSFRLAIVSHTRYLKTMGRNN